MALELASSRAASNSILRIPYHNTGSGFMLDDDEKHILDMIQQAFIERIRAQFPDAPGANFEIPPQEPGDPTIQCDHPMTVGMIAGCDNFTLRQIVQGILTAMRGRQMLGATGSNNQDHPLTLIEDSMRLAIRTLSLRTGIEWSVEEAGVERIRRLDAEMGSNPRVGGSLFNRGVGHKTSVPSLEVDCIEVNGNSWGFQPTVDEDDLIGFGSEIVPTNNGAGPRGGMDFGSGY